MNNAIKLTLIMILVGALFITGIYLFNKEQPSITNINNDVAVTDNGILYNQLTWNNVRLRDDTKYYDDGSCNATYNGMTVNIEQCNSKTMSGRNIVTEATLITNRTEGTTFLFIYEGKLQNGNMYVWRNYSHSWSEEVANDDWISNYLVDGIVTYTDIGTPNSLCEFGNTNNNFMYNVTRHNSTGYYNQIYCFTSRTIVNASSIRINGNRTVYTTQTKTGYRFDYYDITNLVEDVTANVPEQMQKNFSFYKVTDVNAGTYDIKWSFTPKGNATSGKWHILAYPTSKGIIQSYQDGDYMYQDPTWNSTLNEGLMAYYTFNESSGTTAFNSVDNSRYNVTVGNTWFSGLIGNAYNDSAGATLGNTMLRVGALRNITFNFWFKCTTPSNVYFMGTTNGASAETGWYINYNAGAFDMPFNNKASGASAITQAFTCSPTNWKMITVVINIDKEVRIYQNGTLSKNASVTWTALSDKAFQLFTYRDGDGSGFNNAAFDEFSFYNRTLSASEVSDLWNGGSGITFVPPSSPVTDTDTPLFYLTGSSGTVNGSQYNPNNGYLITTYINRTNGTVGIEFNGVNYTAFNSSDNFYFRSFDNLAVGTYPYYIWARGNGTTNIFNRTVTYYFTMVKNTSSINLTINGVQGNATTNNITAVTFNATLIGSVPGNITLYQNGTLIASGITSVQNITTINNIGNYTIKANFSGNENFTSSSEQWNLEVNAFASDYPQWSGNKSNRGSSWTYRPTRELQFNITWVDTGANRTLNVTFYWNGVPKAPSNISNEYYVNIVGIAAGNYTYWWNATDQAGFSNRTENNTFIMEKNIPEGSITISPSDPEILNGTTTTVTGVEISDGDGDIVYNLTRDGVQVSNPDVQTFLVNGTRVYVFSSLEGQNYTAGEITRTNLTIIDGSLSWPTRRFNNSLTTENLTMTGTNSIIRSVAVPSSVSFVTQGIMNLSGDYYYNGGLLGYNTRYLLNGTQNKGIASNSTNILLLNGASSTYNINVYDLNLIWLYNITLSASWGTLSDVYANDTNIFTLSSNATGTYLNKYNSAGTYVSNVRIASNSWGAMTGNGTDFYAVNVPVGKIVVLKEDGTNAQNITLNTSNVDPTSISSYLENIYVFDDTDNIVYRYYTNGTYSGLTYTPSVTTNIDGNTIINGRYLSLNNPSGADYVYEDMLNSTPKNLNVSINGKQAYYYPGFFNQSNNRTTNFYNLINNYIATCTYVSGWCHVPITFTSSTGGILSYSDMYYSDVGFYENNNIYTASTYETKNETFIYNISYNSNFYTSSSANLIYDGITYTPIKTVTTGAGTFTKTIDVPLINSSVQNKSFYWVIYLTNNTGQTETYNSSIFNQTISSILFDQCNTTLSTIAINYSIYNETSRGLITSSFKATFEYFLGSGTVKKNKSVDLSASNNYTFCISPNATYTTDASIKLSSSGYLERSYFLNDKAYSNISTNEPLYLLDSGVGRTVILEFKDTSLRPLAGYYIETWRKYDALGVDLPVHIDKTDNFGQVVEDLVENTVKYKFKFYDSNNNLVKTTNDYVVVACRYTVCVITFLDDAQTNVIGFNNLSNYEYSLYFDNSTNTFIYSWNDNTGASPHHRLYVKKTTFGSDQVICNTSSTALTGSLSCYVGGNYSSYSAQAFRFASPEKRIGLLNVQVGDITRKFGIEGLLWSFFLLMMLIVIGIWYPPVGVALYIVGFILLSVTGIIRAPPEVWIAQIAIGVAFIWAFRG